MDRGYCLMIGGDETAVRHSTRSSRPLPLVSRRRLAQRGGQDERTAEHGYLHCGPAGAGHFVKMRPQWDRVRRHGCLRGRASISFIMPTPARSGGLPMPRPRRCATPNTISNDLNLADITEVWRRGSVIASWLLDLTALALLAARIWRTSRPGFGFRRGPLDGRGGYRRVAPAPVISAALYDPLQLARRGRFSRTRCSQRCDTRSAATWKRLPLPKETPHDRLSFGRAVLFGVHT